MYCFGLIGSELRCCRMEFKIEKIVMIFYIWILGLKIGWCEI